MSSLIKVVTLIKELNIVLKHVTIILQMNAQNLVPEDSDRESDSTRSASLQILADSDTGSDVEQYLNI